MDDDDDGKKTRLLSTESSPGEFELCELPLNFIERPIMKTESGSTSTTMLLQVLDFFHLKITFAKQPSAAVD